MFEDRVKKPRDGEDLDAEKLRTFLGDKVVGSLEIFQYPSGHSNLTYLVRDAAHNELVIRRPPRGANIKSGHDMSREFRVLSALYPVYSRVPRPVAYCDDLSVLGVPFFVMERVEGVILRGQDASGMALTPKNMASICETFVQNLVDIHGVELTAEIRDLGRPEGYVQRQVVGWTARYEKAKTDDIPEMNRAAAWLAENMPEDAHPTMIHNDYKYDNIVFTEDLDEVAAVLDWEMATVGDPLMDLGTTLAYWVEPEDPDFLQEISGPTALPGNLTRLQLASRYAELSGRDIEHLLFYYVYGLFKIGVIGQQIYKRYAQGLTKDPRFGALIFAIQAVSRRAVDAIETGKI